MNKYITIQIPEAFYQPLLNFIRILHPRNSTRDALLTFLSNPIHTKNHDPKAVKISQVEAEQRKLYRRIRLLEERLVIADDLQQTSEDLIKEQEEKIKTLERKVWEAEGLPEGSDTEISQYGESDIPTDEDYHDHDYEF
jgi:hypothetical protein